MARCRSTGWHDWKDAWKDLRDGSTLLIGGSTRSNDAKVAAIDQKVSRQFIWMVGIMVTVLLAVVAGRCSA